MNTAIKKLTLATVCALASSSAYSGGMADAFMPEHVPNIIGVGVGMVPDYMGSDDYTAGVAPMARYQFDGTDRFILLMANELDVNLMNNSSWRAGPVLNYSFGRDNVEDDVVDRMDTLDGFLEYGAFLQYRSVDAQNPRNRWSVGVTGLFNSESDNEGYRVRLAAQYFHQLSTAVDFNMGAGLWYADSDWNNYMFGVNPSNVGSSGLPFYSPDGGMNQYFVNAGAIFYLSKSWALGAGLRYSNIAGDAGDSPLVGGKNGRGDQDQWIAGLGLTYLNWK